MIQLTSKQRKYLEKKAQPLNPLVQVGNSGLKAETTILTEEQIKHIDKVIGDHELIKVKYNVIKGLTDSNDRQDLKNIKADIDKEIEEKTSSTHVRTIGNVAIFYRPAGKAEDRKFEKDLSKLK